MRTPNVNITFDGELCEDSSVGDDEPVAEPCPASADPSLLDLESAILANYKTGQVFSIHHSQK